MDVLKQVEAFLKVRGLNIKASKTRSVPSTTGFDFLGWHFQAAPSTGKLKVVPSQDNYQAFRKKVKAIVNSSGFGAVVKAQMLAPLVRGWRYYHRYCHMHGSQFRLWFMNRRAFVVFKRQPTIDRYQAAELVKQAFPSVGYKVNGHVKVRGDKSPYDGDFVYWSKRNSKLYGGLKARVLRKQHHRCGQCQIPFDSQEKMHLHHVDGNHDNWKPANLLAVHESCHDYIHMSKSVSRSNPVTVDDREPYASKEARTDLTGRGGAS